MAAMNKRCVTTNDAAPIVTGRETRGNDGSLCGYGSLARAIQCTASFGRFRTCPGALRCRRRHLRLENGKVTVCQVSGERRVEPTARVRREQGDVAALVVVRIWLGSAKQEGDGRGEKEHTVKGTKRFDESDQTWPICRESGVAHLQDGRRRGKAEQEVSRCDSVPLRFASRVKGCFEIKVVANSCANSPQHQAYPGVRGFYATSAHGAAVNCDPVSGGLPRRAKFRFFAPR